MSYNANDIVINEELILSNTLKMMQSIEDKKVHIIDAKMINSVQVMTN